MAERRYATNRPSPRLEKGDEAPRPACDGNWPLFYALIDTPSNFETRKEAAKFCGPCPIRDACLTKHINLGGADEAWATAIQKELSRPKTRICEWCAKPMEISPKSGTRRRFCDDVCGHMARAANRTLVFGDIAPEVRAAHADFVRMRNAGMAAEHIPADVRTGERTYQALRHQVRKTRAAA